MLHVIYRSYGGENSKGRPEYYSKLLAMTSMIRAFEALDPHRHSAELIFLNDGFIPPDRLRIMEGSGEVVFMSNLGMAGSMQAALSMPVERCWAPDDLVWFAEDDYLYLPHAFCDLTAAAATYPDADYFALYALVDLYLPSGTPTNDSIPKMIHGDWLDTKTRLVGGRRWRRSLSTTSTFAGRVRAIAEDRSMMKTVMLLGGAWDHVTCLMYQGLTPYPLANVLRLLRQSRGNGAARTFAYSLAYVAFNSYQKFRQWNGAARRLLVAPEVALITHLETAFLAQGTDWQRVAEDVREWAKSRWDHNLLSSAPGSDNATDPRRYGDNTLGRCSTRASRKLPSRHPAADV